MKKIRNKRNEGITLIALVITIIVLLILAGISIQMLAGDNSILSQAGRARDLTKEGQEKEFIALAYNSALSKKISKGNSTVINKEDLNTELTNQGASADGESPIIVSFTESQNTYIVDSNGNIEKYEKPQPMISGKTVKESIGNKVAIDNTELKDDYMNKIVVPKSFKFANDSGTNVKEGIVIEDKEGNQYVWVPVSNINHDGSNKIKINSNDVEGVEITLGRYVIDSDGTFYYTPKNTYSQLGVDYDDTVTLQDTFQEISTYRESTESNKNTTAKNLQGFIESVKQNNGYYIARYEASYRENGKAASKKSTSIDITPENSWTNPSRVEGGLWNYVTQTEASTACQNLYTDVNSDLMNSYTWDTTLIYIQTMLNNTYANQGRGNNTTLLNTGETTDQVCKINNLADNTEEWTTEYCFFRAYSQDYPCVIRGGSYASDDRARYRKSRLVGNPCVYYGFRSILYL